MIKAFIAKHGSGFLLHMAGAVAIMALGWWWSVVWTSWLEIALIVNTILWPGREVWQHSRLGKIWSFHRIIEWVPAVLVGLIMYAALQ